MHWLYVNTAAFYIKHVSFHGFVYLWASGRNQSAPQTLRKTQMVGTRENMEARWGEFANLADVWRVSCKMGHSLEDLCRKWAAGPVAPWRKTIPGGETSPGKAHGVDVPGMSRHSRRLYSLAQPRRAEQSRMLCHLLSKLLLFSVHNKNLLLRRSSTPQLLEGV